MKTTVEPWNLQTWEMEIIAAIDRLEAEMAQTEADMAYTSAARQLDFAAIAAAYIRVNPLRPGLQHRY